MSECVEACLDDHIELFNQYSDNLIEHAKSLEARIEALEKAARGVVEARGIGFMQVHKEDVPEFMHLMNRIDKLAALLEEGE